MTAHNDGTPEQPLPGKEKRQRPSVPRQVVPGTPPSQASTLAARARARRTRGPAVRCQARKHWVCSPGMDDNAPRLPSARVWQAQGMVSEQAGCPLYEALDLMKERARIDGRDLEEIAAAVVSGKIEFRT